MVEHKDNKRYDYDPVYSWSAYFISKKEWGKTSKQFWRYYNTQSEGVQRKILNKEVTKEAMPQNLYKFYLFIHHRYKHKLSTSQ